MHDIALQSGWESFLLAAPFVGMVLVGIFRLDKIATNSGLGQRSQFSGPSFSGPSFDGPGFDGPSFDGNDENGRMHLLEPDGRSWSESQPRFDVRGPAVTTPIN